jgi:dipeptidase E
MGKIVAIGGGELSNLETLPIDQHIVDLTGKQRAEGLKSSRAARTFATLQPRALFIPTASSDAPDYAKIFEAIYGEKLGCETDVLWLLEDRPLIDEIGAKILAADLI